MDDREAFHGWLSQRHPDLRPIEERIRASRRRQVLRAGLPAVAVLLGAVLVIANLPETARAVPDVPSWQKYTGLALLITGAVGGLVTVGRPRAWASPSPGSRALSVLAGEQTRALRRQVLGQAPFVDRDLPATRVAARDRPTLAPGVPPPSLQFLVLVGLAVGSPSTLHVTAAVAGTVWTLVCLLLLRSRFARARRFLAEHPVDVGSTP